VGTKRIVVFPPLFVTALPAINSAAAELMAECKGAFAQLLDRQGTFIDFAIDNADARDPRNFMDLSHYRAPLARRIESEIAAAVKTTTRPPF
jgi:hypothetical protein